VTDGTASTDAIFGEAKLATSVVVKILAGVFAEITAVTIGGEDCGMMGGTDA